nr:TrmH family RNA methyltransferase [Kofleriaceae bacterium]
MSELPTWGDTPILVGDHIENPGNVDCLRAAAALFDVPCGFVGDTSSVDALAAIGVPIVAVENEDGADDLFKLRPIGGRFAIVVGNERTGVSRELLRRADRVVQIRVRSTTLNCLNVAAAAAIALYRLAGHGGQIATRGGRTGGRPTVLIAGVADAIELGSAIRSAACLGWTEVCVDDRRGAWFDVDRVTRSLGRGAARRGRNPIRVRPPPTAPAAFDEVCVVGTDGDHDGEPLRRADLARGPRQLVVLGEPDAGALARLAPHVRRVRIEVAVAPRVRRFRLEASIALAEIARQVG